MREYFTIYVGCNFSLAKNTFGTMCYKKKIMSESLTEGNHCVSFDNRYKHWWLQQTCDYLGENVGRAWLDSQYKCPYDCAPYNEGNFCNFKGIVSRDFRTLFLFHWIDLKVVIGPEEVLFHFNDVFMFKFLKIMLRR
jgi:hypothetical protein